MAHDSKLTLVSDDILQKDASKETLKDLVSLKQDDGISVHGGASVSSGEKEQELHAVKESREERSKTWSISPDENLTTSSKEDLPSVKNIQMSVPVLVVPAPSLQTVSSTDSFQSLEKEPEDAVEKVLGHPTPSMLKEAELEVANLMNEEASHTASGEDSPDNLHSLMNCRICQLFVRTVDRLLDKSEETMDRYMPLTEEEIGSLKQTVEELDTSPEDHQKTACLDRITALSSRLRQRAYMMALGKLRLARRSTHSNLSQLQLTMDLIERAQQHAEPEFQRSHEKLNEMCSQWTRERKSAGELPPYKQEEVQERQSARELPPYKQEEVQSARELPPYKQEEVQERQSARELPPYKQEEVQETQNAGELPPYKQEEVPAASSGQIEAGAPLTVDGSAVPRDEVPRDGDTTEAGISPLAACKATMERGVPSAKDRSSDEALMILTTPGCREENGFPSTEVPFPSQFGILNVLPGTPKLSAVAQ